MSLLEQLYSEQVWWDYLTYKIESGHLSKRKSDDLKKYILNKEYEPFVRKIACGESFNPPVKKILSKRHSSRKRTVYIYAREENYILKLLTYLLIRKYDYLFPPNLYSFRANHGVRRAVEYLRNFKNLSQMYVCKTDIHDYFNSVDISLMIPMLKAVMCDEPWSFWFIVSLLEDSRVMLPDGSMIEEKKGIMAGVPLSSFLANLYLRDMDMYFFEHGNSYARYSDDIIVFTSEEKAIYDVADTVHRYLERLHLTVNEKKEKIITPHEEWEFLGISYKDRIFDVSEVSAGKLKKKMRRKSRALVRWKDKKGADSERAVKAFIRTFNDKLYCNTLENELTWTRWFFPVINTSATLAEIDRYMQDCIRYIATGKRNNGRFKYRYADMKKSGYRSLVHEYYQLKRHRVDDNEKPVSDGNDQG